MSVEALFNSKLTVSRLVSGTGMQKSFQAIGTVGCIIQPLSRNEQSIQSESFGELFKAFVSEGTDVLIGDKVVDEHNQRYNVDGSTDKNFGVGGRHIMLELTLDTADNQDTVFIGYGQLNSSTFTDTLTIFRKQAGTGMRNAYVQIGVDFGAIQGISVADQQVDHESWGKIFRCYAQLEADIQPGDRIIDQLGSDYRVTGVQNLTFGSNPHRQLLLTTDNATVRYVPVTLNSGMPTGLLLALTQSYAVTGTQTSNVTVSGMPNGLLLSLTS